MKQLLIAILLAWLGPQAWATEPESIDARWVRDNYTKREVMVTMRDGARLHTTIYQPNDTVTPHPAIMTRTCYGSGPYGPDNYMALEHPAFRQYASRGYIIVSQDVRGKNMSEGTFENVRPFVEGKSTPAYNSRGEVTPVAGAPVDEASDTYDTVEWLIHNTPSNGRVGVMGNSYLGFYTTMAMLSGHPAIRAVSPQAPVTDWFRGDDAHHNGAFFHADLFSFLHWFEYLNTPAFHNGDHSAAHRPKPTDAISGDLYNAHLRIGAIRNYTALNGDSIELWKHIIAHPDLDQWWEDRNPLYHIRDVKPAVMVVGGLFDAEDCYGTFATYKGVRDSSPSTELSLVVGPWSHGAWKDDAGTFLGDVYFGPDQVAEWYNAEVEYPFFAYYLEDKGEKPQQGARIFDSGTLRWMHLPDGWPAHARYIDFPLTAGATYISDPSRPVPYTSRVLPYRTPTYMVDDQRFAATRPDVAVFTGPLLSDSLSVLGEIEVELDVTLSTTDADFIVKLIDVFPDDFSYPDSVYIQAGKTDAGYMGGYQMLVRGDVVRGKYRDSLADPKPFTPGEPTRVKFTLPGVAHTFLPGHRVMVQVQSSWFPIVDRNPQRFCDIYTCDDSDFQPSTVTILPTSRLRLPVK